MKVGDKVLIRDDNGNFSVLGVVTKAEKRARTLTVQYGTSDGVFNRYDLKRLPSRQMQK